MWKHQGSYLGKMLFVCALIAAHTGWAAFGDDPTEGTLSAFGAQNKPLGLCPLRHTEVSVEVAGGVARVDVTQEFVNPYPEPIEAVYVFPLSDRGAVDRMSFVIEDRVIKGVVKAREEAQALYDKARKAGKVASLLSQERPNIFTQSVANIPSGRKIEVSISYIEYLKYEKGLYEFVFPMVVGPRYIPGRPTRTGTTQVPDANKILPPYVPAEMRPGNDISINVRLAPGVSIGAIDSVLHEITVNKSSSGRTASVRLKNKREIPNRDFILQYAVAGDEISDAVLTHRRKGEGFVTLCLYPPARTAPDRIAPKEMIFVIDRSGSMSGFPIEKAKKTMRLCIENMNPEDTFNLISFSSDLARCFPNTVPNTPENRAAALKYLGALDGDSGTEMLPAIRAALGGPRDEKRLRIVCFMSDGFVGNDMELLGEIKNTAGAARFFAFGIGNDVNRFFIEQAAREGRGAAEIVTLESKGDDAAQRFCQRIQSPVLRDITVDFGDLPIEQCCPDTARIPDLFTETPLVLTARYTKPAKGFITVRGNTPKGPFERKIRVELPRFARGNNMLGSLWARARVDSLMAENWQRVQNNRLPGKAKKEIVDLGIRFGIMTQYTSFIAVDKQVTRAKGRAKRIEVPVTIPDGVSYEGAVGTAPPALMPACKPEPSLARTCPMYANILFDYNSAQLKPEGKAELDKLIEDLKLSPNDTVLIEGHTCSKGDAAYNLALGLRRAEAVKAYLVQHGIDANRVTTKSCGMEKPAVANDTEANQRLNRRAVILLTTN